METLDVILGLLGVSSGVLSTVSDFSGAYATLLDTVSAIIEFVTGLFG